MLDRETVEKVSMLARLRLSDAQLEAMTRQLGSIVDYVDQLNELDTSEIQPMAHAVELTNVFAEDVPRESLSCDEALANAPKHDQSHYLVPAVLGD